MSHNYSKEEVYSFTQYINVHLKKNKYMKHILPINPDSEDLFDQLWATQGLLLQQLIFLAASDVKALRHHFEKFRVVDRENVFQSLSNIYMCLEAAKQLGIKIIGISQENFQHKDKYLVLGVVWQLIRKCLCNKVEKTKQSGAKQLKQEDIEPIILDWASYLMQPQTASSQQFDMTSFADGSTLLTLMTKIGQDCLVEIPAIGADAQEREKIDAAFIIAEEIGIERFLRPEDFQQKNGKLIFSFLAEVFSASIQREMAVGQDTGQQKMQKCSNTRNIQSGFVSMITPMSFKDGLKWDVSRAGGQLDVAETCIFALEVLKQTSMTQDFLNETIYSFFMSDLTESDFKQLVLHTVRDIRDGIDELMKAPGKSEQLRLLTSCLMTLASDEEMRIEIAHTEFYSVFKRLMGQQSIHPNVYVPITFYGAVMDEENNDSAYQQLFADFYKTAFESQLSKLSYTERCALVYSLSRQDGIDQSRFYKAYIQLIGQLFDKIDDATVQNAALLYNCMQFSNLSFKEKQAIYRKAASIVNDLEKVDIEKASLLRYYNAQLMLQLLNESPKEALALVEQTNLVKLVLEDLDEFDMENVGDRVLQRNLFTTSTLISAIKRAAVTESGETAYKIRQQLSAKYSEVDRLYGDLVENYLGNEMVRQSARNNVEGLLNFYEPQLVDDFSNILERCAKSSSQTAFIQSLKDMRLISRALCRNNAKMLATFDLILAGVAKFESELVFGEALSTFSCFAGENASFFVTSRAICEIDYHMLGLISNKAILYAYLELIEAICRDYDACLPLLTIVHANLARVPQYHTSADIIIRYYAALNQIAASSQAAGYFSDYLRFFAVVLYHLAEGLLIAKAASQSCALVLSKGYAICQQAFDRNVFEKLRVYAKGYKDRELIAIVKNAHAIGQYYLLQLQEEDVAKELDAL